MLQNSVCHHQRIPMVVIQIISIGLLLFCLLFNYCLCNSFNVGTAHIIGFSSEFYYYTEFGFDQIVNQYKWLEQDLIVKRKQNK